MFFLKNFLTSKNPLSDNWRHYVLKLDLIIINKEAQEQEEKQKTRMSGKSMRKGQGGGLS